MVGNTGQFDSVGVGKGSALGAAVALCTAVVSLCSSACPAVLYTVKEAPAGRSVSVENAGLVNLSLRASESQHILLVARPTAFVTEVLVAFDECLV